MRILVLTFVIAMSVLSTACADTMGRLPSGLNYNWGGPEKAAPSEKAYKAGDNGETTDKMPGVPPMPAVKKPDVAQEQLPREEVVLWTPRAPYLGETIEDTFAPPGSAAARADVPPEPPRTLTAPPKDKIRLPAELMDQLAAEEAAKEAKQPFE